MKISIALCTYNGGDFLAKQLESFVLQTRAPHELIVCDDGSSDDTLAILRQFSTNAPFAVQIFANERNLGSTKNFEKAISLCDGDLIFLSDQDDIWHPKKIEILSKRLEANPRAGMAFSSADIIDERGQILYRDLLSLTYNAQIRSLPFFEALVWQNIVTGATMVFRSSFRELFLPIPIGVYETIHDAWISLVIASQSEVEIVFEPLVLYRKHSEQQLGVEWHKDYVSRRVNYESSIVDRKKEIKRLEAIRRLLAESAPFQSFERSKLAAEKASEWIEEKKQRIKHFELRQNLSPNRINRLIPIFYELQTGRYGRFSLGLRSAIKDLIEKIDA